MNSSGVFELDNPLSSLLKESFDPDLEGDSIFNIGLTIQDRL